MPNLADSLFDAAYRGKLDDHFSGHMPGPCVLNVLTPGDRWLIDLPEGETTEFAHEDEDMAGTFHVRPGTVIRHDRKHTGLVGFNMEYGTMLLLDADTQDVIARSASIIRVD
jgi:hypothetical protein